MTSPEQAPPPVSRLRSGHHLLAPPQPQLGHLLGLLLVACATLQLQISWTRVLSVSLWYHFAFLVVSTAMLGFGISGVLLTVSRRLAEIPLRRGLLIFSSAQAITTLLGFFLANHIPFAPFSLLADASQLIYAPAYILCIAAPFVCSGCVAALLLSRMPASAGRIYACDLGGASLGCFFVLVALPAFGGSGAVMLSAALALGGTLCFAFTDPEGRENVAHVASPALRPLLAAALLGIAAAIAWADTLLPVRISPTKRHGSEPVSRILASDRNLFSAWDTSSRIDVLPSRWGRSVLIDGGTAMTRIPRVDRTPEELGPIEDERRIVLDPTGRQSVLIIGSGGGWEVLAALRCRARRVVAVEINPLVNQLVTGPMSSYVGNIFASPAVELHTAEARSFIRRSRERYDAIMASHTISNAASASGALTLAEEYVLTVEAFSDYLDHLAPGGRLWISRPTAHLPRLATTARRALAARGVRDATDHVILFSGGPFYGGLVVSAKPISSREAERAARRLARARLRPLHLPAGKASTGLLSRLLALPPAELRELYRAHPTILEPATDDRPFFNQRTRWGAVNLDVMRRVFTQQDRTRMALEDQPVAEVVLLVVLVQSALLALGFVLAPLWWRKREALRRSAALLSYFLLLGLGFIIIEVSLIQRLTLFVGEPVHAFAAVVGTLLLASGLGSALSRRIVREDDRIPRRLRWLLCAIAGVLLLFDILAPPLLRAALALPLGARVAVSVAVLLPLGLLLGTAFPLGLRWAGRTAPRVIPWGWGLNAVASVVGSVAAIILAMSIGFSRVLWVAAAIYGCAAALWLRPGLARQAADSVDSSS